MNTDPGSVVSRVERNILWLPVSICGAFALAALFQIAGSGAERQVVVLGFSVFGGVLILVSALIAVWVFRARVEAGSSGLRWRGLGGWKQAAWSEVSDYYLVPEQQVALLTVVETTAGKLDISSCFTNTADLREAIRTHALNARTQEWDMKGVRPEDPWPQVYTYTGATWTQLALATGLITVAVVFSAMYFQIASSFLWFIRFARDIPGYHGDRVVSLMMYAIFIPGVFFVLVIGYWALGAGLSARECLRRRGESLTLDREDLIWRGRGREIRLRWEDLTGLDSRRTGIGLATARVLLIEYAQGTVEVLGAIWGKTRLIAALDTKTQNRFRKDWERTTDSDFQGAPASFWSGAAGGTGEHIHHYRSKDSGLWFLHTGIVLGVALVMTALLLQMKEMEAALALNFGILVVFMYLLWRFRKAQVRTGEVGIEYHTPTGVRRIAWGDIPEYHLRTTGGPAVVKGGGKTVVFWSSISQFADLKSEVKLRAVNAVTKDWQSR